MKMDRSPRWRVAPWALAASVCLAMASPVALGQADEPDSPFAEQDSDDMPIEDRLRPELQGRDRPVRERALDKRDPQSVLENNTVDALFRLTVRQLRDIDRDGDPRTQEDPNARDYRRTALAMSVLQRYTPDDAERLRFILDAWTWAGDKSRANEVLKRLVRLAPDDTMLQLRLIENAINRKQSADDRLAMYERLLDSAANRLDDSVKSRLALDAALLYREMGDEARYVSALGYATELDQTNKEAAALYATYFLDKTDDPLERLEVMVNVVIADPHDAGAHFNVAHMLMERGAWEGAQRFLQRANDLYNARGEALSPEDLFDIALTIWNADGEDEALTFIQGLYERELLAEQRRREELVRQGRNPRERPVLLPVNLETIRLAIHTARGDSNKAQESMERIANRHQLQLNVLRNPETRPPGVSAERALELEQAQLLRRIAARLWSGQQLDLAEIDLTTVREINAKREVSEGAIQRFEGLLAAQQGEHDEARELLEPLMENDPLARLGMAIVAQRTGETNDAIRHYAHAALMKPNSVIGSAARLSIELIRGQEIAPTASVKRLNEYALSLGRWIDDVTRNPYSYMQISLTHTDPSIEPLDRMELELSLTNVSRHPIAVGPSSPIQSRVLLSPDVTVNNPRASQNRVPPVPEVVRLERRLRLMPGESIDVPVWPGRGWIGAANEYAVENGFSVRWRAIQNFFPTQGGGYDLGPLSVTTRSDLLRRAALPFQGDNQALAQAIRTSDGVPLLQHILQAVGRLVSLPASQRESVEQSFGEAMLARMETMTPVQKAYTITKAARGNFLFSRHGFREKLKQLVADETEPLVHVAMMLTFLQPSDDAYLEMLESGDDPVLAELATIRRAELNIARGRTGETDIDTPVAGDPTK